jgi:hypothetical protein
MVINVEERFIEPIINGTAIHFIKTDSAARWGLGASIQFSTGKQTKEYKKFKDAECNGVQDIQFIWKKLNKAMANESDLVMVFIDGVNVTNSTKIIDDLIQNGGFTDRVDFFTYKKWNKKSFIGKIIHWTNFRYRP